MLNRALRGLIAGLCAGLFTAVIILASGAWEVIGVKFQVGPLRAFMMHLLFGSLSGLLFALLLGKSINSWPAAWTRGILFSVCLYLVVSTTVMPLRLGEYPSLSWGFLRALLGHGIFGIVLASAWQISGRFWPPTNK